MKKYLLLALAAALVMTLIPAAFCAGETKESAPPEETTAAPHTEAAVPEEETVCVFMSDTGKTETLSMRDYVISAVAGEMPAVYEPEALKAQALAAVTLARYLKSRADPDPALAGADVSTDPRRHQGYLDRAQMEARWGENYDTYYGKIAAAVDAVLPFVISYNGAPILAAFHAISPGRTESAQNVWGKAIPYLVPCESEGDRLSPGFASRETVSPAAFLEALSLPAQTAAPETWIGAVKCTDTGTLLTAELCGKTFTGAELRRAFSLRSAAVTLRFDGENFVLDVSGYGHGVGMSQYGADYYARQGMTCEEIVAHYYPGAEITEYFS